MVMAKYIKYFIFMALEINNDNYSNAQYRVPTNDRTPPINPNNYVKISSGDLSGNYITIFDSILGYKVEDSIEKRGDTPFHFVHSLEFLNLTGEIDSAKNNTTSTDIIMVDYYFTFENNGVTASTSYIQTAPNLLSDGTISLDSNFVNSWLNNLRSIDFNFANSFIPAGQNNIASAEMNWDNNRFTLNVQNAEDNIVLNLVELHIIVNRSGNIVRYDVFDGSVVSFIFTIDLINAIHNPIITNLAELHPQQVFYKTLKVKCFGTEFSTDVGIPLVNCTESCEHKFLVSSPVQGSIDTPNVNTTKSLSYQAIFSGINAVTRRIVSYVTFDSTSSSKNSQAARNLSTLLFNVRTVNFGFSFSIRPLFLRDSFYRPPIFVYLEGLRSTASKKKQFISEELTIINKNSNNAINRNNNQ